MAGFPTPAMSPHISVGKAESAEPETLTNQLVTLERLLSSVSDHLLGIEQIVFGPEPKDVQTEDIAPPVAGMKDSLQKLIAMAAAIEQRVIRIQAAV